jgi:putative DNA primase/helicase
MADLLEIARSYASAGLSVIPVGKDKKPRCRWAEFQTHIADDRELARWFSSQGNIALVTGKVSVHLVAIDFDEPRFYQSWLGKVGELSTGLVVQKTGNGFHVIFRSQEPIPNLKLAFVADEHEVDGRRIAIETRGEGGYILVAPSIHPNGSAYTIQSGSLTDVPTIKQCIIAGSPRVG